MDIVLLKNKIIKERYVPHKLIFTGEEEYLQKSFISLLKRAFAFETHYYDDYEDMKESLRSNDIFDEGQIYIIRESKFFLKNYKVFNELNISPNKILILIYDEIDYKKDLFAQNKDILCEFHKLTQDKLKIIINQYFSDLYDYNISRLCELVDNNCQRLFIELNKLSVLNEAMSFENSNELFKYAMDNELIHEDRKESLLRLSDEILNNNLSCAFKINNKLEKEQDDIFKLINRLYEQIKNKLNDDNFNKLINKLFFLQKLEQDIKLGKVENNFAYDYLIINLIGKGEQ